MSCHYTGNLGWHEGLSGAHTPCVTDAFMHEMQLTQLYVLDVALKKRHTALLALLLKLLLEDNLLILGGC